MDGRCRKMCCANVGVYNLETHSAGSVAPHAPSGPPGHVKRLGLSILYNRYRIKAPALSKIPKGRYLILYINHVGRHGPLDFVILSMVQTYGPHWLWSGLLIL